jgi:hypothetical protein
MLRRIGSLFAAALFSAGTLCAQEAGLGAGRIEISAFPGGGLMFMESGNAEEPDFTNYAVGGSFTLNFNRWVGAEGEVGWAPGIRQRLSFNAETLNDQHTPCLVGYNGNLVVNPFGNDRQLVPYATGGVGGLTMIDTKEVANLGINAKTTYPTASVGGGMKWFASRHVGLRADYRFFMVKNQDTAPLFFGRENRYGHRVYGGLLLTY